MNSIFIESEQNSLVIKGDSINKLKSRHKIFLKRRFQAEFNKEKIVINNISETVNLISELCDFFKKNSISYSFSENLSQDIELQLEEEKSFAEFSRKAKNIWNNEFDVNDFKLFESVVKTKMKRILYPLQLLSAYHLAFSQNAANFSVPGAGKTSIVYGAFSYLSSDCASHNKRVEKLLVVGPLSSFGPWEIEYGECFEKKISSKRISGSNMNSKEKKEYFFSTNTSEVTLMSYQSLINQKENVKYFLKNNNVMLILDEAHKIKNTNGGLIADTTLELAKYSKARVILTGTPAPNGYQDLYNLFKFLWPSKQIIRYNLFQLEEMNNQKQANQELIDDISPYFVRINKNDLNLPPKNEHSPILVDMDGEQEKIYRIIEKKAIEIFEEDTNNSFLMNLKRAKLIRMMQAASNPSLLKKTIEDESFEINEFTNLSELDQELIYQITEYSNNLIPPKFYEALKLIEKIINSGGKVIVWAVYVQTVKAFHLFLKENNVNSRILFGETPVDNDKLQIEDVDTREKIIRDFHCENSEFKVIIANPFAVAESISLHKACHNAIYLEKNFDAARFVQSKDRIHRYGLSTDVVTNYYYLITKDTIEEVIHRRLLEKEEMMIQIMESKEIPLFQNLKDEFENDVKAVIDDYVNRN